MARTLSNILLGTTLLAATSCGSVLPPSPNGMCIDEAPLVVTEQGGLCEAGPAPARAAPEPPRPQKPEPKPPKPRRQEPGPVSAHKVPAVLTVTSVKDKDNLGEAVSEIRAWCKKGSDCFRDDRRFLSPGDGVLVLAFYDRVKLDLDKDTAGDKKPLFRLQAPTAPGAMHTFHAFFRQMTRESAYEYRMRLDGPDGPVDVSGKLPDSANPCLDCFHVSQEFPILAGKRGQPLLTQFWTWITNASMNGHSVGASGDGPRLKRLGSDELLDWQQWTHPIWALYAQVLPR